MVGFVMRYVTESAPRRVSPLEELVLSVGFSVQPHFCAISMKLYVLLPWKKALYFRSSNEAASFRIAVDLTYKH